MSAGPITSLSLEQQTESKKKSLRLVCRFYIFECFLHFMQNFIDLDVNT